VRSGMNLEQFCPCRILDVFDLKSDGDMVLDIRNSKSRVEFGRFSRGGCHERSSEGRKRELGCGGSNMDRTLDL